MSNIEDLKRKQKELEYNKLQLEEQIKRVTKEIEILKSQRFYLNTLGYIANIPNCFDENTVGRLKWLGNYFETVEEAEKEIKKRELQKEIEEFRNERNGYWKDDFEDSNPKHCIVLHNNKLTTLATFKISYFPEFGYFERLSDCERAIEIFGDRILELYVD
jgi:hypothetical protein